MRVQKTYWYSYCSKSAQGSNIINKNSTYSMLTILARKSRAQKKRVITSHLLIFSWHSFSQDTYVCSKLHCYCSQRWVAMQFSHYSIKASKYPKWVKRPNHPKKHQTRSSLTWNDQKCLKELKMIKPVAQGQYVVSDTHCPALLDWEFQWGEAGQRPQRG